MIKTQTLKGFRDFLPQDARKRQYVITTLKIIFERFGFEPLETPTLEYEEVLAGKYGDEGEKLMYRFEDNGKRRVAMRYDQTVPLARVVAQYQNDLPIPFKRYQIQNVWRAENTQKGRYREFLQCDIDIVGTASSLADAEIVVLVAQALKALGFRDYRILVNDRKVFGDLPIEAIISIDKLKKIGEEGVIKELEERGFSKEALKSVKNASLPDTLKTIIETASQMGVDKDKIIFEPTLARGLDYYTGLIIEVEVPEYSVGSVGGGGRYDKLLGLFTGKEIPAVGFAFGFDRIIEAMNELKLFPNEIALATSTVLVSIFSEELKRKSIETCSTLRSTNMNAELYLGEIKEKNPLEKQLKYAIQKNIPYMIVIGPEEAKKNVVTLKNLQTREQKQLLLEETIKLLTK